MKPSSVEKLTPSGVESGFLFREAAHLQLSHLYIVRCCSSQLQLHTISL